jgi:hypothetical protein
MMHVLTATAAPSRSADTVHTPHALGERSCKIKVSGRLSGKLRSREHVPGLPVLACARVLPGQVP